MQKNIHSPSFTQVRWGIRYLLFQHIVLPVLLNSLSLLLPVPLSRPALNFIYYCANFVGMALIFRRFLLEAVGRTLENLPGTLLFTVLGFGIYWALNAGLSYVITRLVPAFSNVNDGTVTGMLQQWFAPMAFATVVLVPIAEECAFRGIFVGGLYRQNPVAAYIVSTALFGAIHVSGYVGAVEPGILALCFLQYVPAGLVLAWAYEGTGNLVAPILIHMLVNALSVVLMR